jgi:hypothetical protein
MRINKEIVPSSFLLMGFLSFKNCKKWLDISYADVDVHCTSNDILGCIIFQVRTFYRRCNRVAACNCAVAVRSGDDVILVDVCGPSMKKTSRRTPYTLKMYLSGDLTPGTEVIRKSGGKTYEVRIAFKSLKDLSCPF